MRFDVMLSWLYHTPCLFTELKQKRSRTGIKNVKNDNNTQRAADWRSVKRQKQWWEKFPDISLVFAAFGTFKRKEGYFTCTHSKEAVCHFFSNTRSLQLPKANQLQIFLP